MRILLAEGLRINETPSRGIAWRDVPVDTTGLGEAVLASMPVIRQAIVGRVPNVKDQDAFERRLFLVRKVISNAVYTLKDERLKEFYPVSLSSRTIVYKGLLNAPEVRRFFPDLRDPRYTTAFTT